MTPMYISLKVGECLIFFIRGEVCHIINKTILLQFNTILIYYFKNVSSSPSKYCSMELIPKTNIKHQDIAET